MEAIGSFPGIWNMGVLRDLQVIITHKQPAYQISDLIGFFFVSKYIILDPLLNIYNSSVINAMGSVFLDCSVLQAAC